MIDNSHIEIGYNLDPSAPVLPEVIKERVNYLSIYLINSIDPDLVLAKEQEILKSLNLVAFNNSFKLFYSIKLTGFKEPIYNYYRHNNNIINIYYAGAWNSRKNARIGEYLIKALELESKVTSERLLDFLDDPIHEVRQYLVDSGFDIPELPLTSGNQYNSHEIRSLRDFQVKNHSSFNSGR